MILHSFFIWLNNFELAKKRVAARVEKGGHNIPEDAIERRYIKGVNNFNRYVVESDDWYIYDNSGVFNIYSLPKALQRKNKYLTLKYLIK